MAAMANIRSSLLCLALVAIVTAQDSCYNDRPACIARVRQDLVDEDKFWFGNRYAVDCPNAGGQQGFGSQSSKCNSPDTTRKSILSRVLKIDDPATLQQIAQTVSLGEIRFNAPRTEFYACGHDFTFPAVSNLLINPLEYFHNLNQSQANIMPRFTWTPESPTTLYTVIVFDIGYFFQHGIYINAIPGQQDQWETVLEYTGPRSPFLKVNPKIFMAIPQPSRLNAAAAKGVANGQLFSNQFRLNIADFIQSLGFEADATRRMAATLLYMTGGVLGASQGFNNLNNCPFFMSELPLLRQALTTANIPAAFSTGPRQYLTSLTVDVQPLFSTEDTMFESCCASQDVPRAQLLLDPFSPRTQMPVQLRNTPRVTLSDMEASFGFGTGTPAPKHTLMLVDFGPPGAAPADPTNPSYIVHWMVTNIQNKDVETGNEVIPYFGSNPFTANQARLYTFLLIEQTQDVNPNRTDLLRYVQNGPCRDFPQRCQYAVSSMLSDWGLATIRGANWYLAEQDAFARMRIYNTWAYKSKKEVCAAVPGFTDPCPLTCQGVALREFNLCNSRRVQHPANHQGCTHG